MARSGSTPAARSQTPARSGSVSTAPTSPATAPWKLTAAGGRDVTLKSWPEDPAWAKGVRAELTSGLPALVKLVGRPMTSAAPLVIKESVTGSEYAGFFDPETSTITVGEDYRQPSLVQHELAHVWFNGSVFADVWLSEGHAEWAGRAVSGDEDACTKPVGRRRRGQPRHVAYPSGRAPPRRSEAAVQAEYDAACYLVTRVAKGGRGEAHDDGHHRAARASGPVRGGPGGPGGEAHGCRGHLEGLAGRRGRAGPGAGRGEGGPGIEPAPRVRRHGRPGHAHAPGCRPGPRTTRSSTAVGDWVVPAAVRSPLGAWASARRWRRSRRPEQAWTITGETDEALDGVDARHGPAAEAWATAATVQELDAAASLARTQLDAAKDVAETAALIGQPLDFAQLVGMVGAPLPSLDRAVDAVRNADADGAARVTASVRATINGLRDSGRARIAVALAVLVSVLALLILLVARRTQAGPRRRSAANGAPADGGGCRAGGWEAPWVGKAGAGGAAGATGGNGATGAETGWPPVAIGTAGPMVDDSPTQAWTIPFAPPSAEESIPVETPAGPGRQRRAAELHGAAGPPGRGATRRDFAGCHG